MTAQIIIVAIVVIAAALLLIRSLKRGATSCCDHDGCSTCSSNCHSACRHHNGEPKH